jgi:hypothetical protein
MRFITEARFSVATLLGNIGSAIRRYMVAPIVKFLRRDYGRT